MINNILNDKIIYQIIYIMGELRVYKEGSGQYELYRDA